MNNTKLQSIMSAIDTLTDTSRKRHLVGGILLSASLMFTGLAVTVITINRKENKYGY